MSFQKGTNQVAEIGILFLLLGLIFVVLSVPTLAQNIDCCNPTAFTFNQVTHTAETGETITLAELEIQNTCYTDYIANLAILETTVEPTPLSGSFVFNMSPVEVNVPIGQSQTSNLQTTLPSELSPGIYQITVLVEVTCQQGTQTSTIEGTFTLTVEPSEDQHCCSPTIQPQQTGQVNPGESFTLSVVEIENRCATGAAKEVPGSRVQVEDLKISPDPNPGSISIIPISTEGLTSQSTQRIPLNGSVSSEVPDGIYEIDLRLRIICETIFGQPEIIFVQQTFTLEVGSAEGQILQGGVRIEGDKIRGACAAPGTTLLIPVRGVVNPEEYKWKGQVLFGRQQKKMDLVASSERMVVTVVPPDLEGRTKISLSDSSGQSNPVFVDVDPTCISNGGEPLTEDRLRRLAEDVPPQFEERATDKTGELLSFVPGEILVQTNAAPNQLANLRDKYGVNSFDRLVGTNIYVARLEDRSVSNTLNTADQLARESLVEYASENGWMTEVQEEAPLNDPEIGRQEQLKATNMFSGWKYFFPIQGRGLTLAIVDTGLDLNLREEIRPTKKAPQGVNVAADNAEVGALIGTSTAEDRRGHGTRVSGLAAANGNNESYGAGVAFNSRVLPIKVFGRSRFTPKDIIGKGLVAAYYLEADVVNMSLGCSNCRPSKERKAREYFATLIDQLNGTFAEQGLVPPIVVAATGNDGEGIIDSPAADLRVIAVGSWNPKTEQVSDFSNYGKEIDFVAPGEHLETVLQGGKFGQAGAGTSFASPQVAGLVALIVSTQPKLKDLGVDAVREKIKKCFSVDVGKEGFDNKTGWGLIKIPDPERVDREECLIFKE